MATSMPQYDAYESYENESTQPTLTGISLVYHHMTTAMKQYSNKRFQYQYGTFLHTYRGTY